MSDPKVNGHRLSRSRWWQDADGSVFHLLADPDPSLTVQAEVDLARRLRDARRSKVDAARASIWGGTDG